MAGWTNTAAPASEDFYLAKTNAAGTLLWQRTFGGSSTDRCQSAQQTKDGGYIMVGWTSSLGAGGEDVFLVKTDPSGTLEWSKPFGGVGNERGYSVQQTKDGGYIIAGVANASGGASSTLYLIKTDCDGNSLDASNNAPTNDPIVPTP